MECSRTSHTLPHNKLLRYDTSPPKPPNERAYKLDVTVTNPFLERRMTSQYQAILIIIMPRMCDLSTFSLPLLSYKLLLFLVILLVMPCVSGQHCIRLFTVPYFPGDFRDSYASVVLSRTSRHIGL